METLKYQSFNLLNDLPQLVTETAMVYIIWIAILKIGEDVFISILNKGPNASTSQWRQRPSPPPARSLSAIP